MKYIITAILLVTSMALMAQSGQRYYGPVKVKKSHGPVELRGLAKSNPTLKIDNAGERAFIYAVNQERAVNRSFLYIAFAAVGAAIGSSGSEAGYALTGVAGAAMIVDLAIITRTNGRRILKGQKRFKLKKTHAAKMG